MLLAIDSGNTNIVFSLFDDDDIVHTWRCHSDAGRTCDEYAAWLSEIFRLNTISWSVIKHCIIASVVPDAERNLIRMCESYMGVNPLVVGKNVKMPFKALVDNPDEVGADRLVNGVSAYADYGMPCIILDFGTATTFDVFNKDGHFLGGIIAPGVNLSLEALHKAAAKLPVTTIAQPTTVIGKNTVHAMQSGLYWGYVSLIEGMIKRIQLEMNLSRCTVIATGGLAPLFQQSLPMIHHCDEDLTVRGLKILHNQNA